MPTTATPDRCLCVDEKGHVVDGDAILYIYGRYMKERGKLTNNTIVTTVMSNFGLYKALDELGIEYAKTPVGDKYVYEYMAKNSCRIGGEQSGHIIFSKYGYHRRRHSDQPQDDGGDAGPQKEAERAGCALQSLSAGAGKRPRGATRKQPSPTRMCRLQWPKWPRHWGTPAGFWSVPLALNRWSGSWWKRRRGDLPEVCGRGRCGH